MFISDGEPWDVDDFMTKLSALLQIYPKMQLLGVCTQRSHMCIECLSSMCLRINTVAFGHSMPGAESNRHGVKCDGVDYLYHLQQLAAIGPLNKL